MPPTVFCKLADFIVRSADWSSPLTPIGIDIVSGGGERSYAQV